MLDTNLIQKLSHLQPTAGAGFGLFDTKIAKSHVARALPLGACTLFNQLGMKSVKPTEYKYFVSYASDTLQPSNHAACRRDKLTACLYHVCIIPLIFSSAL